MAIAGLLGAMARMMGKTPRSYTEKDDVAAGVLIRYQMSPQYAKDKRSEELLANMLLSGMSPDDAAALFGRK